MIPESIAKAYSDLFGPSFKIDAKLVFNFKETDFSEVIKDALYEKSISLEERVYGIWERVQKFFLELYNYFTSPTLTKNLEGLELVILLPNVDSFSGFLESRNLRSTHGGLNGAYYVLDEAGAPVGVFKPENITPSLLKRISLFVKSLFGQASCLSHDPLRESKAELAAHSLNAYLGLEFAPKETFLARIGPVVGVYLQYIKGMNPANEEVIFLNKETHTDNELTLFQQFAIMDFLMGNLDRHLENWFVKIEQGELKDIKGIDHAHTFPAKSPFWFPIANQYAWTNLGIAKHQLTEKVKRWVLDDLKGKSAEGFIEQVNQVPNLSKFITEEMTVLLRRRFEIVQEVALKPDFKIEDFSSYRLASHLK